MRHLLIPVLLLFAGVTVETRAGESPRSPEQVVRSRITTTYAGRTARVDRIVGLRFPADAPASLRPLRVGAAAIEEAWASEAPPVAADLAAGTDLVPPFGPAQTCFTWLEPLWSAARADGDRLEHGFPAARGGLSLLDWSATGAGRQAFDRPTWPVVDGLSFFRLAPSDDVLLVLLPAMRGPWAPGERRVLPFTFRRGPRIPYWNGTISLDADASEKGRARVKVLVAYGGADPGPDGLILSRTIEGHLLVTADGRLRGGHLEVTTHVTAPEEECYDTDRASMDFEALDEPPAGESHDEVVARLRELGPRDGEAYRRAVLDDTTARACRGIEALRPGIALEDVHSAPWSLDALEALRRRDGSPEFGRALLAYRLHGETAPYAALVFGWTVEEMKERIGTSSGDEEPEQDALAFVASGRIFVRPVCARDLRVLAHEVAHVAELRHRSLDASRYGLTADGPDDRPWLDADAVTACAAFQEGQAEILGWSVALGLTGAAGHDRVAASYRAGEAPPEKPEFFEFLHWVAYRRGATFLARRKAEGEPLGATLARVGPTFSGQTREVLFPARSTKPSVLHPRSLALRERDAVGASRVGAFGLLFWLVQPNSVGPEAGLEIAASLEDDVMVRTEEGALWVLRFESDEAARRFEALIRGRKHAGHLLHRKGAYVVATAGDISLRMDWLKILVPPHGLWGEPAKTPQGGGR